MFSSKWSFCFCLGGILVGVSIFALLQMNHITIQSYQRDELSKTFIMLKKENEALQLQITQLQSVQNIKQIVNRLKMIAVDKVNYLSATPAMMVQK